MKGVSLITRPEQFFKELLEDAQKSLNQKLKIDTEFYIVNLLTAFIQIDRLYTLDADGNLEDEPLALMFLKADENASEQERGLVFRRIGDLALYFSGFFSSSFARKLVDVDYYIKIGASSYLRAAEAIQKPPFPEVLHDLSSNFTTTVDLLSEIAEKTATAGVQNHKSLLRWYELWSKTGSERLAKLLRAHGIEPSESIKTKYSA